MAEEWSNSDWSNCNIFDISVNMKHHHRTKLDFGYHFFFFFLINIYPFISINGNNQPEIYKEGRSQRLKRDEANERNQEKKAIAADNWYLLHGFAAQPSAASRTVVTLAVEDAAASRRYDKTKSPTMMTNNILGWRGKHFMKTEYASTTISVMLHGITKPMTVTK